MESNWELTEFEFVEFAWNNEKARANRRKHGVDFEDAAQIFRQPIVAQAQFEEGEDRWQAIGTAKGSEFVVIFTETEGACRIVSAWRADKKRENSITRFSADELANRPAGKTDWARINALTDEEIAKAVAKDRDAAGFDPAWSRAKVYFPKLKQLVSLRLDPDILAFFKARGPRYQTRMNAVLRAYMEHELAKESK